MKKIFYKIILIISFIPYILILFGILRSFLFGFKIEMLSGLDMPLKYGVEGVLTDIADFITDWYHSHLLGADKRLSDYYNYEYKGL